MGAAGHGGYAPWSGGADVHQTCTRMARADYCGKGTSFTRDGTAIDVYDTLGVQTATGDASMRFEAAWGPSGALCVSRPRYDARWSNGDVLLPSCWSSLPRCDSLEEASTRFSAQLGNSSRIQSRAICATP